MAKPYQIIANLLALFALAYVGVDTFYRTLQIGDILPAVRGTVEEKTPQTGLQAVATDYEIIKSRNIFGVSETRHGETVHEAPDIDEILAPTTLRLTLLGTVAAVNGESRAIIRDDIKKKQNIYRSGDVIQGAEIKNILRGKVVLSTEARNEILIMKERLDTAGQKKTAPSSRTRGATITNISLQHGDVEKMKANLSELLNNVTVRQYVRSGKSLGVIITRLKRNSALEKLGLQKGDVITTINNKNIREISDFILLYEKLTSGGKISLKMIRRGKNQQINYTLK